MDYPKMLFWRRYFQVSGVDLNPSSSSSHIRILSSNCTFDTIVVLVIIIIKNEFSALFTAKNRADTALQEYTYIKSSNIKT